VRKEPSLSLATRFLSAPRPTGPLPSAGTEAVALLCWGPAAWLQGQWARRRQGKVPGQGCSHNG